jgi:hypothetical protein
MNVDLNLDILTRVYGDLDVTMDILCPEGIAYSEWFANEQATDEEMYADYLDSVKNRNAYMTEQKGDEYTPIQPLPFDAFLTSEYYEREEPDYYASFIELFSNCVWDVFSANNAVILSNRKIDLGSWRGSAQFIADFVNHYCNSDYVFTSNDFYCGNIDDAFRADYLPIYEFIFKKLKEAHCVWVIDEDITMSIDAEFGEELERNKAQKLNEEALLTALSESLSAEQMKRVGEELKTEKEKEKPDPEALPAIVQAYLNVFGTLPLRNKKKNVRL